jgi:hypothetical protein
MSKRISRRIVASALLAFGLGLFSVAAGAAPVPSAGSRKAAVASHSLLGALWSQLVHLWAGDAAPGNSSPGGPPAKNDEGPGICPHGH